MVCRSPNSCRPHYFPYIQCLSLSHKRKDVENTKLTRRLCIGLEGQSRKPDKQELHYGRSVLKRSENIILLNSTQSLTSRYNCKGLKSLLKVEGQLRSGNSRGQPIPCQPCLQEAKIVDNSDFVQQSMATAVT